MSDDSPAALRVLAAGPGVTLQDRGRMGHLRYGVNVAGPMDEGAHAIACLAAGVRPGAAAIEVSLGGLTLTAEGAPVRLAVAGGAFDLTLNGRPLPPAVALTLEPDAELRIRAGASGRWCYVAFAAALDVTPEMGSVSTHLRTALGGLGGRALAAGDRIALAPVRAIPAPDCAVHAPLLDPPAAPIRVVLGPQDDYFTAAEIARFQAEDWTVSNQSDRMGCYLDGAPLRHRDGFNIISDGITMGSIQVPGSGRPLVLMADRQPTGGYPKIATLIGADLGRFAQLRPGAVLRFTAVSWEEAVAARRARDAAIAAGPVMVPLRRTSFSSADLLGCNLVSGVWGEDASAAVRA